MYKTYRSELSFSPFYILPRPFKKPHFVLYKGQPADPTAAVRKANKLSRSVRTGTGT